MDSLKVTRSVFFTCLVFALLFYFQSPASAGFRINPCIQITKTCQSPAKPGDPITFSVTLKNCGSITLTITSLTDDHAGNLISSPQTLNPGYTATFNGSYYPQSSPSTNTVTVIAQYTVSGNTYTLTKSASATCESPIACLKITKSCTDAASQGSPINYSGTVTNCGNVNIFDISIVDIADGKTDYPSPQGFSLNPGSSTNYTGSYIPTKTPSTDTVTATGSYIWNNNSYSISAQASATCVIQEGGGNEGCTPGFWKTHPEMWPTPYTPDTPVYDAFGCNIGNFQTLGQAISAKGGGVNKLARHGVAAFLNAVHPSVDYPLSVEDVIHYVCEEHNADLLATYNGLACPLQ